MGASGSTNNQISTTLKQTCLTDDSRETLRCAIQYVKTHGFWIELHFTPQILDIAFSTMYLDVPVAIFPFGELTNILTYFGLSKLHARNGNNEKYRPSKVLTSMSVENYDEDMIREVCILYAMDVVMQRGLGYNVSYFDEYVNDLQPKYYE